MQDESADLVRQIILKVAGRCNIDCSYCYMYSRGSDYWKSVDRVISVEIADAFANRARDFLEKHGGRINVALHGGEPLIVGPKRLGKIVSTIRDVTDDRVDFSIQTNGISVDDEWLSWFAEHNVLVGVSLDGPAAVNDANRKTKNGRGTHHIVAEAVRQLVSASDQRLVRFGGLISVIDPHQDPFLMYNHFTKDLGVRSFNLLLPDADHDTYSKYYPSTPVEMFGDFLCQMYDIWIDDKNRPNVPILRDALAVSVGRRSGTEQFGSGISPAVIVETNGSIQPHDVLRINGHGNRYALSVTDHQLTDILSDPIYAEATKEDRNRCEQCSNCPMWDMCLGGFVAHRYSSLRGYRNPSVYCEAIFRLISHAYFKLLNDGLPALDFPADSDTSVAAAN